MNFLPRTALTARDRRKIFENILAVLGKRFYAPEKLNSDWRAAVESHRPMIEGADSRGEFEQAVSDLLAVLHTSHLGFFHRTAKRASARAALSATYLADDTSYGKRWIFQDVHAGGAAALAGIKSGNILISVEGRDIVPPEHPVFPMGHQTTVEIVSNDDKRRTISVDVARPKGKKLHYIEPTLVEARHLDNNTGYLKIAMFPGLVGVEVANRISVALEHLGKIDQLIVDLRGNTGGGIGALRVMSLLTSERIPVGFAVDRRLLKANVQAEKMSYPRFSKIPETSKYLWLLALRYAPTIITTRPIVLETEGLGPKPFHGNIALLVNRHTASAAEMIVTFAQENHLATIVGEKTAGRLLSATSVKVGGGYRLALPTGAYYTWGGRSFEGSPIEPDRSISFNWRQARLRDCDCDEPLAIALEQHMG